MCGGPTLDVVGQLLPKSFLKNPGFLSGFASGWGVGC